MCVERAFCYSNHSFSLYWLWKDPLVPELWRIGEQKPHLSLVKSSANMIYDASAVLVRQNECVSSKAVCTTFPICPECFPADTYCLLYRDKTPVVNLHVNTRTKIPARLTQTAAASAELKNVFLHWMRRLYHISRDNNRWVCLSWILLPSDMFRRHIVFWAFSGQYSDP